MTEHILKCWPEFFQETWEGRKTFELRKNDRDYQVGDTIILREWDNVAERYVGRRITGEIVYLVEGGKFGLDEEWCIFQLEQWCYLRFETNEEGKK